MVSDCILCHQPTTRLSLSTLPQIIETFKILINAIEIQATSSENTRLREVQALNIKLSEANEKFQKVQDEKNAAEKRSDVYKRRFLDAQNAIKELHEKNMQLSSQKILNKKYSEKFPFSTFRDKSEFSPKTQKIILAPDTCFAEVESYDVTYISSDDDDFQQASKRNSKSPKMEKVETPKSAKKSVAESFFAKPIKSPVRNIGKKRKQPVTPVLDSDMDETRLDIEEKRETTKDFGAPLKHTNILTDSEILEVCRDPDSIPPSPILSAKKQKRYVSGLHGESNESLVKLSGSLKEVKIEKISNFPKIHISSIKKKSVNEADGFGDSEKWKQENPILDRLPLHRLRQTTPTQHDPGNTSLDELFDKTYGDLETTAMLNNTTSHDNDNASNYDETNLNEEDEEELDSLLLEGLPEEAVAPPSQNIVLSKSRDEFQTNKSPKNESVCKIPRPLLDDSFDVLPSKNKGRDFKYQEVVRKRDEREKLDGKACAQCEAYYGNLPENERREIMKKVCRHKHVDAPPSTPEHFWEVGIPGTAECRRRGYIVDETNLPTKSRQQNQEAPRSRRKKPLEPYFSSNKR
ncbi:uncharacterized protein LOC120336298 isoform X2 [Styela clava]